MMKVITETRHVH